MKIGDRIIDNDPRIPYKRELKIVEIFPSGYVLAESKSGRKVTIRGDRIFSDGKYRRSGFSMVVKK